MNTIIWIAAGICFLVSAVICRYLKHWAWIFLGIIFSLPVSFGLWLIAVNTKDMTKVGLGIIALAPVMLIMMAFIDLVAAIVGGAAGIIWRRKISSF